jgi:hypothetical protein
MSSRVRSWPFFFLNALCNALCRDVVRRRRFDGLLLSPPHDTGVKWWRFFFLLRARRRLRLTAFPFHLALTPRDKTPSVKDCLVQGAYRLACLDQLFAVFALILARCLRHNASKRKAGDSGEAIPRLVV